MADHSKKAFEDTIKTILTTFGVFTGFAIKSAIEGIQFPSSPSWWAVVELLKDSHLYICIATIALLLRFIIGSAVHLNLCYVTEPRSVMPVMLFKDLAFLIVFGLLAIFMIKAHDDVATWAGRAFFFVLIGTVWSVVDGVVRYGKTGGEESLFSKQWLVVDAVQLALILFIPWVIHDIWWQAFWFAVGFSVALYLDMKVVLAAEKPAA